MTAPALTLYGIEEELDARLNTIDLVDQEDAELRAEIEQEIAQLVAAEKSKVDGVCRMLAHFEAQAQFATDEAKRLTQRKRQFEIAGERLERCARIAMEIAGKQQLDGNTSRLKLRLNPPAVLITNAEAVPSAYQIVKTDVSIDKGAIKRAIQSGLDVPGAELIQSDRLERR